MPEPQVENPEAVKAEWLSRLDDLVRDVKGWAESTGWRTRVVSKPIDDRRLGRYGVPVLLMEKEAVEIVLNPVSRFVPGAQGAVDLYVAPAYDDIASLFHNGGQWEVHYTAPPNADETHSVPEVESRPYSEATILKILDQMSSHA